MITIHDQPATFRRYLSFGYNKVGFRGEQKRGERGQGWGDAAGGCWYL
jgi:hypothetical protein